MPQIHLSAGHLVSLRDRKQTTVWVFFSQKKRKLEYEARTTLLSCYGSSFPDIYELYNSFAALL